jgi:hypothetical protein
VARLFLVLERLLAMWHHGRLSFDDHLTNPLPNLLVPHSGREFDRQDFGRVKLVAHPVGQLRLRSSLSLRHLIEMHDGRDGSHEPLNRVLEIDHRFSLKVVA